VVCYSSFSTRRGEGKEKREKPSPTGKRTQGGEGKEGGGPVVLLWKKGRTPLLKGGGIHIKKASAEKREGEKEKRPPWTVAERKPEQKKGKKRSSELEKGEGGKGGPCHLMAWFVRGEEKEQKTKKGGRKLLNEEKEKEISSLRGGNKKKKKKKR